MNHTTSLRILVFLSGCIPLNTVAQHITGVQLEQTGNVLAIHYNLQGESGRQYQVTPFIMHRSGNGFVPNHLSGDRIVGTGNNHVIYWQVLEDRAVLQEEIAVKLDATPVNSSTAARQTAIGGGPSNALLSMMLPGLGDVFVNDPGKDVAVKPLYIMAGYSTCVLLAVYSKAQAEENYNAYQKAVQQYEMNDYYDQAIYYRDNRRFYTTLAASIWVCDVVRVLVKGKQNNRAWAHLSSSLEWQGGMVAGQPGISLTYRF